MGRAHCQHYQSYMGSNFLPPYALKSKGSDILTLVMKAAMSCSQAMALFAHSKSILFNLHYFIKINCAPFCFSLSIFFLSIHGFFSGNEVPTRIQMSLPIPVQVRGRLGAESCQIHLYLPQPKRHCSLLLPLQQGIPTVHHMGYVL